MRTLQALLYALVWYTCGVAGFCWVKAPLMPRLRAGGASEAISALHQGRRCGTGPHVRRSGAIRATCQLKPDDNDSAVPKSSVDQLLKGWDKDGDGDLSRGELQDLFQV